VRCCGIIYMGNVYGRSPNVDEKLEALYNPNGADCTPRRLHWNRVSRRYVGLTTCRYSGQLHLPQPTLKMLEAFLLTSFLLTQCRKRQPMLCLYYITFIIICQYFCYRPYVRVTNTIAVRAARVRASVPTQIPPKARNVLTTAQRCGIINKKRNDVYGRKRRKS